jgi:hypothetical protein
VAYANPNYDPKKAHEYYMKHRKLKGRKKKRKVEPSSNSSTRSIQGDSGGIEIDGLPEINTNYELSEAAQAAKKHSDKVSTAGLNDAGKTAAKNVKANLQAERKEKADHITAMANAEIARLREELSGMSKEERESKKEQYQQEIEKIRASVKQQKEDLKKEYDDKYVAELSNIKMNPSFQNQKSTSGMTEEGKAKAKELKNKLTEQRKARQKQIADQVKDKIAQLRAKYKINRNMTDEQKQMIRDKVAAEVQKLRDYAKTEKAKIKEEYDGMYQSGLNNLKQDRSLMRGVE